MKKLQLKLKDESFPIFVGNKLNATLNKELKKLSPSLVVLFYDRKLKKQADTLVTSLQKANFNVRSQALSADEKIKNFENITPLYGNLLKWGADRNSTLLALGGGAIGDAIGFIASTYLRGIPWVGIPTTLLSQVDSSVGGKTGINHPQGKNLIGSFYQPKFVICDTDYLKTLPKREVKSGFAEIVKYGLIQDPALFKKCMNNKDLYLSGKSLDELIAKSLRWKVKAVEADPFDRKGIREKLNFGHTIGHALEAHLGYGKLRHGEAVAWGMRVACALSVHRKSMSEKDFIKANEFLESLALPKLPRKMVWRDLKPYVLKDKKNVKGEIRFVLLNGIGKSLTRQKVRQAEILSSFERIGISL